jgi:hypothetical protein
LGREIELLYSGYQEAGSHGIVWNADNQSSGVYLARLEAAGMVSCEKLLLVK